MLYELILINEIEQRAKILFLSVGLFMTDVQFHPTVSSISFVLNRVFDFMEINQVQCDLRISSLSDTWTHFGAEPPTAFVQVLGVMNEHVIVL